MVRRTAVTIIGNTELATQDVTNHCDATSDLGQSL
jgi:hypothetical protein